ncbi:MAG: TolC family protein, partial [Kiritimatiellae bacterium]|nr:TolC family protein [Kiritimatiellia bacterium]
RSAELEIRGGSNRLSEDVATEMIELELSRPVPGSNRVKIEKSLASLERQQLQLELEQRARNLSLELRTELLTIWKLNQVIQSLEMQQDELERILRIGNEMARDGHLALREIQPYRLNLLQVQRDIREMTRETGRQEQVLEKWVGEIPLPDPAKAVPVSDHDCTALDELPPIRESQLRIEMADAAVRGAAFWGREEPRLGVFVEHEQEENGNSGQMAGVFYSVSLPYRAESHHRQAVRFQSDAAREELNMRQREWRVELSALHDEIETVQDSLTWFDTEILPQAIDWMENLTRAEHEGRVTPLEPALAQVEVLMLKQERLEQRHRLYLLQTRAHRWCGPNPTLFLPEMTPHE